MTIQALFGIAAGILSFVAYPVYIRDILRGETKPSKVTWWVLAFLNAALTASYYASGARDTIWIPISYTLGFSVVAFLSLKYGEGNWEKSDWICLTGAAVSLFLWWFLQSAEVALYLIIITDFIGLVPTIYKTYKRPWTESRLSWSIALIASALNVIAIEDWSPAISFYPFYVVITNALIVGFILFPRHREQQIVEPRSDSGA
ncbi:MAG: hypothetical protein JWO84_462 [Parcubacteria group bacterium]|nr:hypothetical protein [Parcubacteria group bacterium]